MLTKITGTFSTAVIISLLALGTASLADANPFDRQKRYEPTPHRAARSEVRRARAEIHQNRAELRRDYAELARDRRDLGRLSRHGAPAKLINRKNREVRRDLREIAYGHRELRRDYRELRRDRGRIGYGRRGYLHNRQYWNRRVAPNRWGWDHGGTQRHHWSWSHDRR